jgi:hypothetical protein
LTLERLRDSLRARGARWSAASNGIASLPRDRRERYLGYVPGADELTLDERERVARATRAHATAAASPHAAVDLRSTNGKSFVGPIRDQSGMPACVAFAIDAAVEGTLRLATGDPGLSIRSPALVHALAATTCPTELLHWMCRERIALRVLGAAKPAQVRLHEWVHLVAADAMKAWITQRGPLIAAVAVHEDFYGYFNGVYHHIAGPLEGGHCVTVVGFDDAAGYWIAQNSWGTRWGEDGWFRIAYGERGIDASMWGVVPIPVEPNEEGQAAIA